MKFESKYGMYESLCRLVPDKSTEITITPNLRICEWKPDICHIIRVKFDGVSSFSAPAYYDIQYGNGEIRENVSEDELERDYYTPSTISRACNERNGIYKYFCGSIT